MTCHSFFQLPAAFCLLIDRYALFVLAAGSALSPVTPSPHLPIISTLLPLGRSYDEVRRHRIFQSPFDVLLSHNLCA